MGSKKEESYGSFDKYSGESAITLLLLDLEQKAVQARIQEEAIIAVLEEQKVLSKGEVEAKKLLIRSKYISTINEIENQKKAIGNNKNIDKSLKSFTSSEKSMMNNEKSFLKKCFERLFDQ